MAVKIMCDAGSNLFPRVLKEKGLDIKVFSMTLTLNEKTYHCYSDDIDVDEMSKTYYGELKENRGKARTSLVSPGDFLEGFKEEVDKGNQVICFTMAKGISGTYNSAMLAAHEVNEAAGKEVVHIINSATASMGEGAQAIRAYKLVQEGKTFEEIIEICEDMVWKTTSEFVVDDIRYLVASGRVSKTVAMVASALNVKVLLEGNIKSEIAQLGKAIGMKMALKTLAKRCIANIKDAYQQIVYIAHCNDMDDATRLEGYLKEGGIPNIEIYPYDLITGTHVGQGTIALFYETESRLKTE